MALARGAVQTGTRMPAHAGAQKGAPGAICELGTAGKGGAAGAAAGEVQKSAASCSFTCASKRKFARCKQAA